MNIEEKNFNYEMMPGRQVNKREYIMTGEPIISIITPYYNCKNYIKETANCLINQTFPFWEWIIVNDGSTEEGTTEILNEIQNMDKRIIIINQENQGRLAARDNALKEAKCDLVYILDSDDEIDKTVLECAYWSLITNPEATWVYADMVNFDGNNFLWNPKFDCKKEKKENILPVSALIKKDKLLEVGGYSAVDKDVHEDWHLWLRMLEKGYFPIRMNYYGFWYRNKKEGGVLESFRRDKEKNKHAYEVIYQQAQKIKNPVTGIQFPTTAIFNYDSFPYTFDWERKPINNKGDKIRLLFIFPWLNIGGADKFNLDLISGLNKDEYDITIITTEPLEYMWRQKFEEHAEIFDLTSFLQRKDWAAFIHYIMKSRNINIVMESNSYYGYYIIPWLKAEFPEVVFTDYLHSADLRWRNGAYARDSIAIDAFLDKTYTCTDALKYEMRNVMNRSIHNVETVYIGVDTDEFAEEKIDINRVKSIKDNMEKIQGKKAILFLCRLAEEKRPILMLKILKQLIENNKQVVLLVVGDGPLLGKMKEIVKKDRLEDNVIFFGMQDDVAPFYKIADVTVICSIIEGLTLTTYESLAMGTPVVSANIGGQAEIIDNSCGRLVDNIETISENKVINDNYMPEEINRYTKAIQEVLDDDKLKNNCKPKIENGFTIKNMIQKMDKEFKEFIKFGSSVQINKQYIDFYKQYIVLYNEIDKRYYNEVTYDKTNKLNMLKEKLWKYRMWRAFIKILKKTKIIDLAKKIKNKLSK